MSHLSFYTISLEQRCHIFCPPIGRLCYAEGAGRCQKCSTRWRWIHALRTFNFMFLSSSNVSNCNDIVTNIETLESYIGNQPDFVKMFLHDLRWEDEFRKEKQISYINWKSQKTAAIDIYYMILCMHVFLFSCCVHVLYWYILSALLIERRKKTMDSQQELSPPSTISAQPTTMNLQDLQSYLVTFNKEIEPSDQNAFQV